MRTQQYASVIPYLKLGYSYPSETDFRFLIQNTGIGRAFIESISISDGDTTIVGGFENFYNTYFSKKERLNYDYSNIFLFRHLSFIYFL